MRGPHRTLCGRCLDEFDDIWAMKHHLDDCLRREPPHHIPRNKDTEVVRTTRAS